MRRYSQPYDLEMDATSRLQNGGFDDEYQEPQRRINYNYHPIIDFFRPEAMQLQSSETTSVSGQNDSNSWKPMIASWTPFPIFQSTWSFISSRPSRSENIYRNIDITLRKVVS